MGNERWGSGLRVGVFASVVLAGLNCEGEHREYIAANPRAAGGGAAPAAPADALAGAGGAGLGESSGSEPFTEINRLQPGRGAGQGDSPAAANSGVCSVGSTEACGPQREEGICKFGERTCVDGTWGDCVGAVFPKDRDCSSLADNDCDGQADDTQDDVCRCPTNGSRACDQHEGRDGKGQCLAGKQTCILAVGKGSSDWGSCAGAVGPSEADSCELLGNDANCDGTPNSGCACVEGATVPCGPDTDNGICQRGISTCTNGAFGACQGAVFPAQRDCSSPQDNDCDGLPDNTTDAICTCVIGDVQACAPHPGRDGNGPCRAGTQVCEAGVQNVSSRFGACNGSVGPAQRDQCTALGDDSDCNGTRNGGCQCIAGGGNGPCSSDANNSRCSPQGTCAPCQANADCALVSGARSVCNGGQCVAPAPENPVPVVTVRRFAWTSRQGPVDMGTTQGTACFLTRVGGGFNTATDSVQIVSQAGRWVLTGATAAGGFVEARAGCVAVSGVTNETTLQAGQTSVNLQSASTHACFLTHVGGRFKGGAEDVLVNLNAGVWQLGATAQQDGVEVSARCMPMQPLSQPFVMQFATSSPLALDPLINGACYLTRVEGNLGAEGDLLETEWNGRSWDLRRQVGGSRMLVSSAMCFGRNDGSGVSPL